MVINFILCALKPINHKAATFRQMSLQESKCGHLLTLMQGVQSLANSSVCRIHCFQVRPIGTEL